MLCDRCKKNEANMHIIKIVNGHKQEQNLCEQCAKELNSSGFGSELDFDMPFSFPNLLGGIIDFLNKNEVNEKNYRKDLICDNCGTSYKDFSEHGLLGCSRCYEKFSKYMIPVLKRIQGNTEHIGKIPKKSGKDIYNKRIIIKLKGKLQKAIALEEYEKAAEIRDKIREIRKED